MKGYIAVTNRKWFDFHEKHKSELANFKRKNTRSFKILIPGEHVFFLVKNKTGDHSERAIRGYGIYQRYEVLTADKAWEKYQQENGSVDKAEFIQELDKVFKVNDARRRIGCIILSDLKFFVKPVFPSDIGVEFQNSIVSGKTITKKEVQSILDNANQFSTNLVGQEDIIEATAFPEGTKLYYSHIISERNKELVDSAKRKFGEKHGSVYCEVCGFNFESKYGNIGKNYIEAHHIFPVSEMKEGHSTRIEDLVMVCSNCHRMLHRKRPWLSAESISGLLIKNISELSK